MEILTMLILGATLRRLGWKITMCVGVFGYAIRFLVFAFFPQYLSLIILVNVLHGLCYAFFFATVYIFVDAYLPKDARSSAQGLFNVMILGLGALAANTACPWIGQAFTHGGVTDYQHLFLLPASVSLLGVVLLAFFFHPPKAEVSDQAPVLPH
jgi:MFS family permease